MGGGGEEAGSEYTPLPGPPPQSSLLSHPVPHALLVSTYPALHATRWATSGGGSGVCPPSTPEHLAPPEHLARMHWGHTRAAPPSWF